jgi:hypothetical protein
MPASQNSMTHLLNSDGDVKNTARMVQIRICVTPGAVIVVGAVHSLR